CLKLPINNSTWKALGIDQYISSYPNGQKLTLTQFAKLNNGGNFICGYGENCNAGQLCHPIQSPAWQVLYATQEYNHLMNAMTDSINYVLSQLQSICSSMLNDLTENIEDSRFLMDIKWVFSDLWRGIAFGAGMLLVSSLFGFTTFFGLFVATNLLPLSILGIAIASVIQGKPHTVTFEDWTNLSFYVSKVQDQFVNTVTKGLENLYSSGISSENGIGTVLTGGTFFQPIKAAPTMQKMEQNIQYIFQARMIARILRSQNAYVLIYHDECKGSGPEGAASESNVLSYCDAINKVSYNIVRAHKKKTHKAIFNASVIKNKYGFTTEFMTKNSLECQTKYNKFEHDPFEEIDNKITPEMINTDCIFNFPVCDMRNEEIRSLKYDHHKTTVSACRRGGGVPI
ncbi:hypothetical protein BY996DRAFT_4580692, partial [Phakopsora pachyrhizi]